MARNYRALSARLFTVLWMMVGIFVVTPMAAAADTPELVAPSAGSVLNGASVRFEFSDGGLPIKFWKLRIGTGHGRYEYFDSARMHPPLSIDVDNLPVGGEPLSVRFYYKLKRQKWQSLDYDLTAFVDEPPEPEPEPPPESDLGPVLVSPAPGGIVANGTRFAFIDDGDVAKRVILRLGSTPGANDLAEQDLGNWGTDWNWNSGIPTNGQALYLQMEWHDIDGQVHYVDKEFVASATPDPFVVSDVSWPPAPVALASRCSQALDGQNRTINVGPGHEHTELNTVPWLFLAPGDVVNIFHRPEPYRTKFGLRAQGRADAPVIINGVTDANCNRPHIDGNGATTADDALTYNFFDENPDWGTENLGVIMLNKLPSDTYRSRTRHLTLQNLKVTGGRLGNQFYGRDGIAKTYRSGASGVYAIVGDFITLNNMELTENGNGFFVNTRSAEEISNYVIVRNSVIHSNGQPGSYYEHNLYVQARRTLYEGNDIGQLMVGAEGSSLKDRSSGTVVRYNRIRAAAHALDLVENEGGYIQDDPLYPFAWVYGNLIISDWSGEARASALLVHWSGDNDPRYFRNGPLAFYSNTVHTISDQSDFYWLAVFEFESADHIAQVRDNVFISDGTSEFRLGHQPGIINLSGTNWVRSDWLPGYGVTVNNGGHLLAESGNPLSTDYRPLVGSSIINQVADEHRPTVAGADMNQLNVTHEFDPDHGMVERVTHGTHQDPGAFEARP